MQGAVEKQSRDSPAPAVRRTRFQRGKSITLPRISCPHQYHFQQMVPDQVVQLLVQDNLDIACAAIEKAAMERAVSDVDEGFAASYDARRRHREVGLCQIDCIIQ